MDLGVFFIHSPPPQFHREFLVQSSRRSSVNLLQIGSKNLLERISDLMNDAMLNLNLRKFSSHNSIE